MGRFVTAAVIVGIAVLGLAALVDALREGGWTVGVPTEPTAVPDPDAQAEALRGAGVDGTLLYTDSADCALHAVALPSLRAAAAPRWDTCAFALGPEGAVAPGGTVFDLRRGLQAAEFEGGVDVVDPRGRRGRRFDDARAPAFRPTGTLTIVRRGELVSLAPCSGSEPALEGLGDCPSVLVTEDELTTLADVSVVPRPPRLALTAVAWLDDATFATVAQAGASDVLLGVRLGAQPPTVDVWFEDDALSDLEVSPRKRFVSTVTATGELAVFDGRGTLLGLRGTQVRASVWSPDERWLAVLDGDNVLFVDGTNGDEIGRVPLSARDLAWE